MKRQNRRSKRTSVSDSSSPAQDNDKQLQHHDGEASVQELAKGQEDLKGESCSAQKVKEDDPQKLLSVQQQVTGVKKKLITESHCSTRRQKTCEARRMDEIQKLKAQKVQLLCKLKLESVQYRISRASFEREALQLKKELRRKEYEMRKLLALNQRQKLVLQRKTEEASLAGKRLNDLLQCRKAAKSGNAPAIQGLELELKVAARVEEIQSEYDRQMEEMAEEVQKYEEEAEMLRQENFRCLVEGKEVDCAVQDSELRDLREEVVRLSKLVCQFGMPKVPPIHSIIPQVDKNQSSISVGSSIKSLNIDASESENSGANAATMEKSGSGPCCSCSSKSLCRTRKCECKAGASSCGPRCKCAASRCKNRETLTKVDDSLLPTEMAQNSTHLSEPGKSTVTYQHLELKNDDQPPRKPLSEIGNTLMSSGPVKPGKKTRRLRSAVPA